MSTPLPTPTVRKFSASAAAQLMQCPGSARLEESIPGFVHPVRDEMAGAKGVGTRLHEVMYECKDLLIPQIRFRAEMLDEFAQLHYLKRREQCDDTQAMMDWVDAVWPGMVPDDPGLGVFAWLITLREYPPKLLKYAADALRYFATIKAGAGDDPEVWAETSVMATWLEKPVSTTPDIVVYSRSSRILWILDYKTGKIKVSPVDNDQLLYYATCYVQMLLERGDRVDEVILAVAQPDNFEHWAISLPFLGAWKKRAKQAEQKILQGSTKLVPGDKCTFCPANPHTRGDKGAPLCPVMLEMLYPTRIDELAILDI